MKRSQLAFVLVVFSAVLVGIVVEHSTSQDPFVVHEFSVARRIPFEPLSLPLGTQELSGEVVDAAGAPVAGVVVHLQPSSSDPELLRPLAWTFTDEAGGFHLAGLSAGRYRAVLLQPGHPNGIFELDVPASSAVRWVLPERHDPLAVLPEVERAPLLGRLSPPVTAPEQPVENYEVVLRPASAGAEPAPWSGAVTRRALTDAEGFFELADLAVGDYRVQVLPRWAGGGSWPLLDEVSYTHRAAGLERLPLRLRCGEVAGVVVDLDLRPIQGALVLVWPEERPQELWPALTTDAAGEFLVRDLPLDLYVVRIQAGGARHEELVRVQIGARTRILAPPLEPSREAAGIGYR